MERTRSERIRASGRVQHEDSAPGFIHRRADRHWGPVGTTVRVLIINLATATARMAFQITQMSALGLVWERVEAATPETLPAPPDDPRWWRWERPMKATEIAVLASHTTTWERVRVANTPHLIVEDDALLASDTPAFLRKIEHVAGLDHVTLEVRNRKKLVGRRHPNLPIRRLYQDRTGAAAYVLWPPGARKLLSHAAVRPGLADAVIATTYEMNSWQADPALAVQIDQCAAYGMAQPIATESSIGPDLPPPRRGSHLARRIAAQFRLGLRHLSKSAVAERREIALSTNWPAFRPSRDT